MDALDLSLSSTASVAPSVRGSNDTHKAASPSESAKLPLRALRVNLNHWYVVARSSEIRTAPMGVTLWKRAIVLYRDTTGQVHALDDRCPHRQVKLSSGLVKGDELECAYHGWRFNTEGQCTAISYLEPQQKLPTCAIRQYPVLEQDGFVWLFPGDAQGELPPPMGVPEWNHVNYINSATTIECNAHYSFLIENLMDMHHGHLHDNYQAWAEARLESIEETPDRVHAHYQAQSYYTVNKIWSVSQLFIPALRQLHPETLDVSYLYPHWRAALGQDFRIYCLLCPIDETKTRAYLLHFTSLEAFPRLHKLPIWFRRSIKNMFFNSAQKLLNGLVEQDVLMMEQEQHAFTEQPDRRGVEVNRAIANVQRLIRGQAEG